MLQNSGCTAVRREAEELPKGCLVFSDRPMTAHTEGLLFALRVDSVTDGFAGFPLMGFTRRKPRDRPDLYPEVSHCMGQSVLIGRDGKASARDQRDHFRMGFKQPPADEVQQWDMAAPSNISHQDKCLRTPRVGDVLRCVYTRSGRIQVWLNQAKVWDIDTGRPIDYASDYYAVVDVCLSVTGVSIASASWPSGSGELQEVVEDEREDQEADLENEEVACLNTATHYVPDLNDFGRLLFEKADGSCTPSTTAVSTDRTSLSSEQKSTCGSDTSGGGLDVAELRPVLPLCKPVGNPKASVADLEGKDAHIAPRSPQLHSQSPRRSTKTTWLLCSVASAALLLGVARLSRSVRGGA